ncbi:GNAT family N-acetyltransferase [Roseivirga misakiensis]|uniref:N-acetyltransferase domain-containing protein n=1 Tax=Roseivirga misakiensis TaxID=1563681 RepID=A0A1E5T1Z2_9BACT|nr:GNAT family N-acetyltransferase [Roseivirga misakiensis]OEK05398.1 hypothetical protein BFP71_18580 [Roseivirga misakiensis]
MSSFSIKIESVQYSEAEVLRSFGETTFRETFQDQNDPQNLADYLKSSFTLEKIQSQLQNPNTTFYFSRLDGEITGYLKLNLTNEDVEIERIYVKHEFQGRKIGKALYAKALGIAKERSAKRLWLGVWQENKKAIDFYKRQGMEIFDVRTFQLGNEPQDDYLMRIELT